MNTEEGSTKSHIRQKKMLDRTKIGLLLLAVVAVTMCCWWTTFSTQKQEKFVVCSKADHKFDSINVRIYAPVEWTEGALRRGVAYYHGGGWVGGDLDSRDDSLLRICSETSAVIVSVDYRLAPAAIFPAPFEDCVKATQYFFSHAYKFGVDTGRLAIAGDSAGGNLAAAVALKLRDEQFRPQPKLQLLLYPVLQGIDFQLPSMLQNRYAPMLTTSEMCYYIAMYLEGSDVNKDIYCNNSHIDPNTLNLYRRSFLNIESLPAEYLRNYARPEPQPVNYEVWNRLKDKLLNPYFSPLVAETVSDLPKAFVLTIENDPLRDEALLYKQRLTKSGIEVTHRHHLDYHGHFHTRLDDVILYFQEHL